MLDGQRELIAGSFRLGLMCLVTAKLLVGKIRVGPIYATRLSLTLSVRRRIWNVLSPGKSCMQKSKRKGPYADPWGTPPEAATAL